MRSSSTAVLGLAVALLAGCAPDSSGPGGDPIPPDGLPLMVSTPTSFTAISCTNMGGWRRYSSVGWSGGTSSEAWEIAENTSNDTTSLWGVVGGSDAANDTPYGAMDGHQSGYYYTWIRFNDGVDNSAWVPIAQNPLNYNSCSV